MQEIEEDRIKHGIEFDNTFKEAMEKEVEDEKMYRKRKWTGIKVYNDFNRNEWNQDENSFTTKKMWAAMNVFQL